MVNTHTPIYVSIHTQRNGTAWAGNSLPLAAGARQGTPVPWQLLHSVAHSEPMQISIYIIFI